MENVTVGCRLDVYCDVTSSYRWHAYRRAGMLIGNTDTPYADGRTAHTATADFLTCSNVVVELGNWTDYHYCQFINEYNTTGNNWPWVRVEAGENCEAYSNPRYGHPKDINGKTVVNDLHDHNEGEGCRVLMPFAQLYGGGQGVYGATTHEGVEITRPVYTIAYMNGTEVQEIVYVNDNSKPVDLNAAGDHMNWLDSEGRPITQIPAGNTKNIVVHLDDAEKLIAHFLDINGMEIFAVEFVQGQEKLEEPPVPVIEGYNGHWKYYDLKNATASIVVKPVYTVDLEYEELSKEVDVKELFEYLSQGKNLVMSQELTGTQSNASTKECAVITEPGVTDKEAKLNLNGYRLHYDFSANANKNWLIFDIREGSTLTVTGGITHSGVLVMDISELNGNAKPIMFDLDPGAKLILEKGTTIELHYPAGRGDDVSMFGMSGTQFGLTQSDYPYLKYVHDKENNTKRIIVLETTVIEGR